MLAILLQLPHSNIAQYCLRHIGLHFVSFVLSVIEVKALCRPLELHHINTGKTCLYEALYTGALFSLLYVCIYNTVTGSCINN